ncbi:hypothetical protein [uncultured Amaricoccus sp.]|uniref:hypothetical protein n=1 Tax=uncultured Amaricoccus sp. TaxID=339341 RepID=UPI0026300A81|nr:hypothetical protein [uncultured Amaricoccus sp.]
MARRIQSAHSSSRVWTVIGAPPLRAEPWASFPPAEPEAVPWNNPDHETQGPAAIKTNPRNGRSLIARAVGAYPAPRRVEKRGRSSGGREYVRTTHRGAGSKSFCEHWLVIGAGHGWSGGGRAGRFTEPAGPDASREMARFFLRHRVPFRRRGPAGGVPG